MSHTITVALVSMVLSATIMIVSVVAPVKLWADHPFRCLDTRFITMEKNDNTLDVLNEKYTFTFVTDDGKKLPAYIEGYQREKSNSNFCESKGFKKTGHSPKSETIAVYVAVQFKEAVTLKSMVIEGPNNYKVEIDLDEFWGTKHSFKANEKYGMGWYL